MFKMFLGISGGVRDMLERAGFYDKKDRGILYLSIHDAVLVALSDNPEVYKQVTNYLILLISVYIYWCRIPCYAICY